MIFRRTPAASRLAATADTPWTGAPSEMGAEASKAADADGVGTQPAKPRGAFEAFDCSMCREHAPPRGPPNRDGGPRMPNAEERKPFFCGGSGAPLGGSTGTYTSVGGSDLTQQAHMHDGPHVQRQAPPVKFKLPIPPLSIPPKDENPAQTIEPGGDVAVRLERVQFISKGGYEGTLEDAASLKATTSHAGSSLSSPRSMRSLGSRGKWSYV